MGEDTTVSPEEETIITKRLESEWDNKEKLEKRGLPLTLDGKTAGWVISSCDNDSLFHNIFVSIMKGVGAKMKEKLENAGIFKVKDFIFDNTSPSAIKAKLTSISDQSAISLTSLKKFYNQASTTNPGACPPDTNYLFANNPYKARYGDN